MRNNDVNAWFPGLSQSGIQRGQLFKKPGEETFIGAARHMNSFNLLKLETQLNRARIFKRLWSPEIDSKASISPAYVAWRAGTITLFLLGA
jgi:hypothetical protein